MIGFNLTFVRRYFRSQLVRKFSEREAEQLLRILFEDLFGLDRMKILMNPNLTIDEFQYHQMEMAVADLLNDKPIQYVTGVAEFCDLKFKVNESVLIPRPETEEMVQMICATSLLCHSNVGLRKGMESIGDGAKHQPMRIWDIGTGSGCIAVSLAKRFPDAEVFAFDVSEKALQVAESNAVLNKVKVNFMHDDVLHPHSEIFSQPVDLVVSNPPYVCEKERKTMENNVLDWEPENALFVPDADPLLFYRRILHLASARLTENGQVWLEINEAFGAEMLSLCRECDFGKAEILNDFAEKPRFCRAGKQ
ncbi:MAG: peptide chain release factor N(5)-glutamine methyltransferase [Bacteroidales bacterium]|nr:peptide chain release factor N(5)-glutamine methyltransferase [Bacteroidales bacterium]